MQSTVFSQVIKLIPRRDFEKLVEKHQADRSIRRFDSWTWFGVLLFGQLTGRDSIRPLERVFNHAPGLKILGFSNVHRSTFADANQRRPIELLEDVFRLLLSKAQTCAPRHSFKIKTPLLALDASVIDLSLKLMPWARFDKQRANVKIHAAINLNGNLPEIIVVEKGRIQDMKITRDRIKFSSGSTLIFDKGYSNYRWYQDLTDAGIFFVTRMKDYVRFKVVKSKKTSRSLGYLCDQEVYVKSQTAKRSRLGKLRRVAYRDPQSGKKLVFMTNRFDLKTEEVCALYKARWQVELFFKAIKQNLKIKKFVGTSARAVSVQIWTAVIAFVLVQLIRFMCAPTLSLPATIAVLATLIFEKRPLAHLLGDQPRQTGSGGELLTHGTS